MKNKKLLKILMPMATIVSTSAIVLPLASCAQTTTEGVKVSISSSSSEGVEIKETKAELNKDSTVTLTIPSLQAIKEVRVSVGSTNLTIDRDFTVDVNTKVITINASSMTSKDVAVTVFTTKMDGIKASVIDSKKFEAFSPIKASDIKVEATYESSPIGTVNPLVYGTDYIIYQQDGTLVENFDTVGYTFTRAEGAAASKVFTIEYVAFDRYTYDLTVNTEPRYEPNEITSVYNSKGLFVGDKVTVDDLTVEAKMAKDPLNKTLEYGVDYLVYDKTTGKEIENFGTDGYTFTKEGKYTLTVKSVLNPENAYKDISFDVLPAELKATATCATICGDSETNETISLTWTHERLSGSEQLTNSIEISTDNGKTWKTLNRGSSIELKANESIVLKGNNPNGFAKDFVVYQGNTYINEWTNIKFTSSAKTNGNLKVNLFGSALSLLNNGGKGSEISQLTEMCFAQLFLGNDLISSISKDYLSGDFAINNYCYMSMFRNCTSLQSAPDLNDKDMYQQSCAYMFNGCTSLVKAPALPAKTLASACYAHMFNGCTSLKETPDFPAKTLAANCCRGMFMGCTSLEKASVLPATVLPAQCYYQMFSGCTSLVEAPAIYATEFEGTDGGSCRQMFENCSSLTTAPDLFPTVLNQGCYYQMFYNCTALETAPALPATTLSEHCYAQMFRNCTSLKQAPTLPAETLATACYNGMFQKCTSLVTAPALPATTMVASCYLNMFALCDSLINAPKLSATTLADNCYKNMFAKCSSLEIAIDEGDESHKILKGLDTTGLTDVYTDMFLETKNWVEDTQVEKEKTYYWVEQE